MTRPDGIYLNLPEDDYHADPALSASGIKKLLQSPADYWVHQRSQPRPRGQGHRRHRQGHLVPSRLFRAAQAQASSTPSSQTA
jgi:hypothetical protein